MLSLQMKHRIQLLVFRSLAELKAENARLRIGMLWWIIEPMLHILVFYFVFAVLLSMRTEHFVWFLLVGQIVWRWFQQATMIGGLSIYQNRNLIQQLSIEKSFFPSVSLLSNMLKFLVTFGVLLVLLWLFGFAPTAAYVMLPVVILINFLFIAGCVYVLSAIMPFALDMRIIVDNGLRALMFMSGIFFDGRQLAEPIRSYFYLNPMAGMLQAYRDILIDGKTPETAHLVFAGTLGVIGILLGKAMLRHFDKLYPRAVIA